MDLISLHIHANIIIQVQSVHYYVQFINLVSFFKKLVLKALCYLTLCFKVLYFSLCVLHCNYLLNVKLVDVVRLITDNSIC